MQKDYSILMTVIAYSSVCHDKKVSYSTSSTSHGSFSQGNNPSLVLVSKSDIKRAATTVQMSVFIFWDGNDRLYAGSF